MSESQSISVIILTINKKECFRAESNRDSVYSFANWIWLESEAFNFFQNNFSISEPK